MYAGLTIRKKLTLIIMLVSSITITAACIMFLVFDFYRNRNLAAQNLESIAKLIGRNCLVALKFDIPEDAETMLMALSAKPSIVRASVYNTENDIFAAYPSWEPKDKFAIPENKIEGISFTREYVEVFLHIRFEGSTIGSIRLQSNMQDIRKGFIYDAGTIGIFLSIGLLLSYILAVRLQGPISKPISSLAKTAKSISDSKDYSVRALKCSEDEIGNLTDAFNDMLIQIEKSNDKLSKSETKHRRLINNLTRSFVYTHDTSGNIRYVSSSVTQVLGYSVEEFLGHYAKYFTDQTVNYEARKHTEMSIKGIPQPPYEIELYHKNGNICWLEASEVPVRNDSGVVVAVEGIAHDITERKKAEYEREKLFKILASKNEELESIIYASSHDLRTPLVNLQGFTGELSHVCRLLKELLNEVKVPEEKITQVRSILDKEIPTSLDYIISSAKILAILQNGLLKVCRLGRIPLEMKHLNVNRLISDIVKNMQYQIEKLNVTVTVDQVPDCFGDEVRIFQLFTNLIDNAIKYLDPNRKGTINISGRTDNEMSIYCIEDNGVGIDSEQYDKVFEIFYRLDPKGQVTGEGLGLSIVRRIVDRHNGRITLDSELGKGSRFCVYLPSSAE